MVTFGIQRPPMADSTPAADDLGLYGRDYYAWTKRQAELLRLRAMDMPFLDAQHLAEEIDDLGESQRSEIESRLLILLIHLLKWAYQPSRRSSSWKGSIVEQRKRLQRRIKQSPSLRAYPLEALNDEYDTARLKAAGETGLAEEVFPLLCPFTIEEILDDGFYPHEEGSAEQTRKEDR